MTAIQQILVGMNELNERGQNAESVATEAERQGQATQQELARSQPGLEGEEEDCSSATTTRAGDRRVRLEVSASDVRRRGGQVVRMGSSFSQLVWRVFFCWCLGRNLRTR